MVGPIVLLHGDANVVITRAAVASRAPADAVVLAMDDCRWAAPVLPDTVERLFPCHPGILAQEQMFTDQDR